MLQDQNNKIYAFHTERGKGVVGAVIFHIILITILIVAGFTSTPPQTEEGLLVNFGTDDFGSGMVEPSRPAYQEPSPSEPTPRPVIPLPEKTVNTQEHEEAIEVKKVTQTDPEAEKKRLEQIEAEKNRLADLEAERKRLEQEELERIKKEEDERRAQEILDKTRNALISAKNTGTKTTGEGAKTGTGDQGVQTGSVSSNVRGEGAGLGTDGTHYDLAGRTHLSLTEPKYEVQEEGRVVVEITVDRTGRVTDARAGITGSTILNDNLLKIAREAALSTKFDSKPDAPPIQKGTITYVFKLK